VLAKPTPVQKASRFVPGVGRRNAKQSVWAATAPIPGPATAT
jgi:hypothetical protein